MTRIAVIGLGKLGSCLAGVLASKGHVVIGVDKNEDIVDRVRRGVAPVVEPGLDDLLQQHPVSATTSIFEAVRSSDQTFIVVPTPSGTDGRFMNDFVLDAIEEIGAALYGRSQRHTVVVCSTVMPGSMDEVILPALEDAAGKFVGPELGLAYNPEFIALGTVIKDMQNPDMFLIGESDSQAGAEVEETLRTISDRPVVRRMSFVNAEITKIAVNTFITMKISYANVLTHLCEFFEGGDAHVVAEAVGSDKRIGGACLRPGTAYGGPCFPRDTVAFTELCNENEVPSLLSDATRRINDMQLERLIELVLTRLHSGDSVGVLGLSYKPGTPVTEEAVGLKLAKRLQQLDIPVLAYDSLASSDWAGSKLEHVVANSKIVVITTTDPIFSELDADLFAGKIVIDCWSALDPDDDNGIDLIQLGHAFEDSFV